MSRKMKVWVALWTDPEHEDSTVLGVYTSYEMASRHIEQVIEAGGTGFGKVREAILRDKITD